ncbi:hypothetical protein CHS0354_039032 [Potamilus streckersoni]|uniref:Secreted protein n=1 Tax=Potamilus streckersoni TaxID=2493646 RepID=A0AAE0VIU2_9BIVA|nr:hypothetical protein CHS0354_039032 [Potamilus streckersoni]
MTKLVNILVPLLVACFLLVETILASPSSRGNDESDIKESLEYIIQHPLNKERPASYLLGPQLTEEEIIITLQTVIESRDESDLEQLIQLYQVTNGLKTLEADSKGHPLKDTWLIPGYYLLSLREVVETLSTMKKTSGIWNPTWLPLFASRAGDFLVYDTKNGHIYELFTKESLRWEVARNIQEFLQGIARKLRDGRILLNENGLFDEISTDVQTHKVHEAKILDDLYLSANDEKYLEILVEKDNVAVPDLVFDCTNMPNVCQNIKNAINSGKTRSLQRITDQNQIKKNRQAACGSVKCTAPTNSCDEYPFASTSQGGAGATTRCVPLSENNSQGGQLAGFYKKNNVGDKDWFYMKSP